MSCYSIPEFLTTLVASVIQEITDLPIQQFPWNNSKPNVRECMCVHCEHARFHEEHFRPHIVLYITLGFQGFERGN